MHCASGWGKGISVSQCESGSNHKVSLLSPLLLELSASPSTPVVEDNGCSAAYKWCVVLGSMGFLETAYMTYLKLTDSNAFCPLGGDSCSAILNSDYSSLFGIILLPIEDFTLELESSRYVLCRRAVKRAGVVLSIMFSSSTPELNERSSSSLNMLNKIELDLV